MVDLFFFVFVFFVFIFIFIFVFDIFGVFLLNISKLVYWKRKKKKKERADNIVSYVETNRLGFVV